MEPIFDEMPGEVRYASDVIAIWKLQSLYQHYLNAYGTDEIIALFADRDDVEIEIANKGVYVGRDAPERVFGKNRQAMGTAGILNLHLSVNPVIEIDRTGTRAKGLWMSPGVSTFPMNGQVVGCWNWGKYDMEYIKEGNAWKFLHFRYRQVFLTPYEDGWVKNSIDSNFDGMVTNGADRPSDPDFHRPYKVDEAKAFGPMPPKSYDGE